MKDLKLTPLQEIYKGAADLYHSLEVGNIEICQRIIDRIIEVISSKDSFKNIDQGRIEKGIQFIKAYTEIFAYDDSDSSVGYYHTFNEVVRYCYLDNRFGYENRSKIDERFSRLSFIQDQEPFNNLTHEAKRELNSLLILWSELEELTNGCFLFSTKESNTELLPNVLSLHCTRWKPDLNIEPYEWQRVARA